MSTERISWAEAGGPEECEHGYAYRGTLGPCPKCFPEADAAVKDAGEQGEWLIVRRGKRIIVTTDSPGRSIITSNWAEVGTQEMAERVKQALEQRQDAGRDEYARIDPQYYADIEAELASLRSEVEAYKMGRACVDPACGCVFIVGHGMEPPEICPGCNEPYRPLWVTDEVERLKVGLGKIAQHWRYLTNKDMGRIAADALNQPAQGGADEVRAD